MSFSPGYTAFRMAFELSPIILTDGITKTFPGFALPIMAITEAANFPFSLLSGGANISLDQFFAHYQVLPGSSLINQDIAKYPFANAQIAANAVIQHPINVSVLMICPMQNKLSWAEKLAIISGLKLLFDKHNLLGGTYTVLTPSFIYTNCVMKGMHDASSQLTKQVQNTYQLDFERPLLTKSEVTGVLNSIASLFKTAAGDVSNIFGLEPAASSSVSNILTSLVPTTAVQTASQTMGTSTVTPGPFGAAGTQT